MADKIGTRTCEVLQTKRQQQRRHGALELQENGCTLNISVSLLRRSEQVISWSTFGLRLFVTTRWPSLCMAIASSCAKLATRSANGRIDTDHNKPSVLLA